MAPVPPFDDLIVEADFEGHQAQAGRPVVTVFEAFEVWNNNPDFRRNRKSRTGKYLMIGLTEAGRLVTVVLLEVVPRGTWLAYTAWDTKQSDW